VLTHALSSHALHICLPFSRQAARTEGALEDMEDGAFEEDDEDLDEEEEEEEEEDSNDVSRFATAGIDAIARKQVRASCHDGSVRSARASLV
jgi:hypothetical protein